MRTRIPRLAAAPESHYDTRLECRKREFPQRDKAAVIAELIVLLRNPKPDEAAKDKIDERLLQLALYLPPCLVHKLAHTVCQSGSREDLKPFGLFLEIRDYMEAKYKPDSSKTLTAENIPLAVRK